MWREYTFLDKALDTLGMFSVPIIIYIFVVIILLKRWNERKNNTYKNTFNLPSKLELAIDHFGIFLLAGFFIVPNNAH